VIGLPANLFYSTGIPVCILVLKQCKKPDDVLFTMLPSTSSGASGKLLRRWRGRQARYNKIISTYQHRTEEQRYSRRWMAEIEERLQPEHLALRQHCDGGRKDRPAKVHAKLMALDEKIATATKAHNAFLQETWIAPSAMNGEFSAPL
jgi:type I restriction enzyme M protein